MDRLTFGSNHSPARFNAPGEVISNGLPALSLLRFGMGRLRIASCHYLDTFGGLHKLNDARAVAERVFNIAAVVSRSSESTCRAFPRERQILHALDPASARPWVDRRAGGPSVVSDSRMTTVGSSLRRSI